MQHKGRPLLPAAASIWDPPPTTRTEHCSYQCLFAPVRYRSQASQQLFWTDFPLSPPFSTSHQQPQTKPGQDGRRGCFRWRKPSQMCIPGTSTLFWQVLPSVANVSTYWWRLCVCVCMNMCVYVCVSVCYIYIYKNNGLNDIFIWEQNMITPTT